MTASRAKILEWMSDTMAIFTLGSLKRDGSNESLSNVLLDEIDEYALV